MDKDDAAGGSGWRWNMRLGIVAAATGIWSYIFELG